jgi:hypothetical protein
MSEIKNDEYMEIENCGFVYRPPKYEGPIAVDCTVSEAMDEYHKKSKVQINLPRNFSKNAND